ncbi:MAG TPA: 6-phosphogluconolactonase [Patescibacteria group bacterium]
MQIVLVNSLEAGIEKAKEILYEKVNTKTALFLSGGKTPKPLYERMANEKIIKPAAAAIVDERFGNPMHQNSNELMISHTGLFDYFSKNKIPFFSPLQKNISCEDAAKKYDEKVREIFFHFPHSIGITGIGTDGHTAGIAPNREDFKNPIFSESQKNLFVSCFNDANGYFKERITLTFAGLSLLDFIIVLVFGEEKQEALQKVFTKGSLEELPARIYNTRQFSDKTLFITDQKI